MNRIPISIPQVLTTRPGVQRTWYLSWHTAELAVPIEPFFYIINPDRPIMLYPQTANTPITINGFGTATTPTGMYP
jgi:hypothetical protein